MCIQHPILKFTPNKFNVDQINKNKYHKDLHDIYYGGQYDYILYYIWPIISYNNFHSIVDYMKIKVCLGQELPKKILNMNNDENINLNGDNNDNLAQTDNNNDNMTNDND